MARSKKDKDLELWQTWNDTKDPKDLSSLYKNINPLIHHNIKPLRGSVSDTVLEAEAKLQALKAFKSYDPNKNVQLSTHVTNHLKKVNRLTYNNMELLSVPENRRIKFKNYEATESNLEEELGRPPPINEMADALGWSKAEVSRHKSESWKELSASNPNVSDVGFHDDANNALASYVYNDLSPKYQSIFEMTTGYGSSKEYSSKQIMKKMKMSQGQLSYAKSKIKKSFQKALGQYGE
jgi:DNA-directed RNA polymerase specialized sigma subunit